MLAVGTYISMEMLKLHGQYVALFHQGKELDPFLKVDTLPPNAILFF